MNIKTNHQYRPLLCWHELTEREKKEVDYLEGECEQCSTRLFRYRGNVYDVSEFLANRDGPWTSYNPELKDWDAIKAQSYFSAVLVKLSECGEAVKVGRYYS